MRSTTKNGKSEMGQILGDGRKWKTGTNFRGRREYILSQKIYQINRIIRAVRSRWRTPELHISMILSALGKALTVLLLGYSPKGLILMEQGQPIYTLASLVHSPMWDMVCSLSILPSNQDHQTKTTCVPHVTGPPVTTGLGRDRHIGELASATTEPRATQAQP